MPTEGRKRLDRDRAEVAGRHAAPGGVGADPHRRPLVGAVPSPSWPYLLAPTPMGWPEGRGFLMTRSVFG